MGNQMKLSIIVPTLDGNVPASLRTAVAGRTDVEVVVIKGVSPVGKARNEGLRRATGDYLAWVDADDEVTEDWLPSILKAIEAGPDLITFDWEFVGWGSGVEEWSWGEHHPTPEKLMRAIYHGLALICTMWVFVAKRELWRGLEFDERTAMAEDYVLAPKLLIRVQTVRYIRKKLYRYVSRETSLVHRHGFMGDDKVMELKRQRATDAPRAYRCAAVLGLATACYGVVIREAHGFVEFQSDAWRREAEWSRWYLRRNFVRIGFECLFRVQIPFRQKLRWLVRFVWSCLPERVARMLVRRG